MEKYTIKQAADILNVSKSTVRRRIKSGKLNANKEKSVYGEQYFIPADEIDQAIAENEIMEFNHINRPIDKEKFINDLKIAMKERDEALIDDVVDKVANKLEEQQDAIKQDNEALIEEVADKVADKINQEQQKKNEKLVNEIEKLKELQQKTLFDKIKEFFT